jgi:DDE family transposase
VAITPADVQDRDGFIPLLKAVRRVFVFLQRIFADGGYSRAKTAAEAKRAGKVELRRPTAPTLPLVGGTTAGPPGSSRRKLQQLSAFT